MWPFGEQFDTHDPEAELQRRIVRLCGEITEATAHVAIAQLLFLQSEDRQQPMTLYIESPGGTLAAGMAIGDTVRYLQPLVHTRAPFQSQGVAAIILASGRHGERSVGPAAKLSIAPLTPFQSPAPGDAHRMRERIAGIIAELTGQDRDTIATYLQVGRNFTPSEAVAFGLADRVEV